MKNQFSNIVAKKRDNMKMLSIEIGIGDETMLSSHSSQEHITSGGT